MKIVGVFAIPMSAAVPQEKRHRTIRPDGMVHAPDQPGLGFTLRADALERFRYVDGPEFEF
jgi:L-alanine-DL-glutamate epimerase-like enolase superfamily enzyme